jgi:hypothetical protein
MKNILTVGCSIAVGEELPDYKYEWNDGTLQFKISEYSYPSLIAKHFQGNITNLGMPGGSNHRMLRLAIDETLKKNYDLIICGWTAWDRLDLRTNGEDISSSSLFDNPNWIFSKFDYFKEFIVKHYDSTQHIQSQLGQILCLQDHFRQVGQKYLFMFAWPYPHEEEFRHITQNFNHDFIVDYPDGLSCDPCPKGHPSLRGHRLIADKFIEKIKILNWC